MKPFKPSSEMTFTTAQSDFDRFIIYLKGLQETALVFDLADVTRCDSAGLALLVAVKRHCIEANKRCHFADFNNSIQLLADLCGVAKLLTDETL